MHLPLSNTNKFINSKHLMPLDFVKRNNLKKPMNATNKSESMQDQINYNIVKVGRGSRNNQWVISTSIKARRHSRSKDK
jgi:hypothetical protein